MTRVLAFVLLAACGSSNPTAPDPAKFKAMSEDEQCAATEPRAVQCIDELLVASAAAVSVPELTAQLSEDLPPATPDEARKMHRVSCIEPGYTAGVFACWSTTPCKAFASCVFAGTGSAKR